jgi:SWI/SNF-related matrix-associated actin-dependent regulator 1 of chromatin subfamily A
MAGLDEFKARGGANAEFSEYSEAWAELGLAKVPYALNYVETLLSGGWNKVLVFAHHIPVAEALREGFADMGYQTLMATGEMSSKKRSELVDLFQKDPNKKVFVLTIDSMGMGHTLTAASYGVMVEFSTVPGKNKQAEDRMHRIGQGDNVFIDYLVLKGSLDYPRLKQGRKRNKNFEEIMA